MGRKALKRLRKRKLKKSVKRPPDDTLTPNDVLRIMMTSSQNPAPSNNAELFNLRMANNMKSQELDNYKKELEAELQKKKDIVNERDKLKKDYEKLEMDFKKQKADDQEREKYSKKTKEIQNQIDTQKMKNENTAKLLEQQQNALKEKMEVGQQLEDLKNQNNQLEKKFYQVKSNKVVDNIRIVALADLHLKEFGKDNEKLVAEVKNLSPDIVAIVGDMNLESQPDNYSSVISLCKQLNEIAPVYYCLGNHEIDAMLFKNSNIYKDIKAEGIKIFNNETETVNIGGTAIDIIGLTQNPTEFDEYGKDFFEKAMSADDNFKLLLTHYPEYFLGKLNDYDIDLAITGHAHGGQVRLPFIGGLYAADQGLFPKLCDGYHEDGNSKFIVSRGLGKSGIVPRINNKPEIVIADISWY